MKKLLLQYELVCDGKIDVTDSERFLSGAGRNAVATGGQIDKLRVEDMGYLDPDSPEKFTQLLPIVENMYQSEATLKTIHKSMIGNKNMIVNDWYAYLIASNDPSVSQAIRSVNGWISLIKHKFEKTDHEKYAILDAIKFDWKLSIPEYIVQVQRLTWEAGERSTQAQIHHIVKHLPDEFLIGFDIEQYSTVEALERSLRGREAYARKTHNFQRGNGANRKNQSPVRDRYSPSSEASLSPSSPTAPSRPCNDCGTFHWRTGIYGTECPPKQKSSFQQRNGGYKSFSNTNKSLKEQVAMLMNDDLDDNQFEDAFQSLYEGSGSNDVNMQSEGEEQFHDSHAYLVDFDNHGKLIDFNTKDYTGVYLVDAPNQTPSRKNNKVIRAKALGPVAGQHSYKNYTNQQILVRDGDSLGMAKWRPADTCSPMSFVSSEYLKKHHPSVVPENKDDTHRDIAGIVSEASTKSKQGCWLKLYLPMVAGEDVLVEGYFHILDKFDPGLLLGQDMNVPYGFRFDTDAEKYYVRGANNAEGRLLVRRDIRSFRRPVKMAKSLVVKSGHTGHVPISMDPFKGKDMVFFGKAFINSAFGEEGKANGHLMSDSTNQVRFSNLGDQPISLKKGCVIGWIELLDESDAVCLFSNGLMTSPNPTSMPRTPPEWSLSSSVLSKLKNPWKSPNGPSDSVTATLVANAKVNDGRPCCRSKYPFADRIPSARECVLERV